MKTLRCTLAGLCGVALVGCVATPETPDTLAHWAAEHGYQRIPVEDQGVYCRAVTAPGTRLQQTECIFEKTLAKRKYDWDHRNLHPGGPTGT
jgi:hypothetical protein